MNKEGYGIMAEIKMGIFGAWRGNIYLDLMMAEEEIDVVAVCEKNIDPAQKDEKYRDVAFFRDFETFITEGKKLGIRVYAFYPVHLVILGIIAFLILN